MKERLDVLLVRRGLAPSRERAKALIMAGSVFVDGGREDKPGSAFDEGCEIAVRGEGSRYVSRGGLKLEKALEEFGIFLAGKVCMDVGSSTGGFTDCMLQHGARKVYAVDVGTNQLSWKLRQDARVVSMERTNARYLTRDQVADGIEFASVDVSFISLGKILAPVRDLLLAGGECVCLIKPQFEAGREQVGKKGVVRDPKVQEEVIRKVMGYARGAGLSVRGLGFSPIKGPEGNIEFLLLLRKEKEGQGAGGPLADGNGVASACGMAGGNGAADEDGTADGSEATGGNGKTSGNGTAGAGGMAGGNEIAGGNKAADGDGMARGWPLADEGKMAREAVSRAHEALDGAG